MFNIYNSDIKHPPAWKAYLLYKSTLAKIVLPRRYRDWDENAWIDLRTRRGFVTGFHSKRWKLALPATFKVISPARASSGRTECSSPIDHLCALLLSASFKYSLPHIREPKIIDDLCRSIDIANILFQDRNSPSLRMKSSWKSGAGSIFVAFSVESLPPLLSCSPTDSQRQHHTRIGYENAHARFLQVSCSFACQF